MCNPGSELQHAAVKGKTKRSTDSKESNTTESIPLPTMKETGGWEMHDVSMQVVCTRTAFDNMCHENAQGYERMYEYVLLAFGWPVTSLVTHTYNMYSTWHQVYTCLLYTSDAADE